MPPPIAETLATSVGRLLRPLVRILLRHGIPHQTFAEWAKQAYVDVGSSEFAVPGRKASISHTAVITGLTRKEVSRLLRAEAAPSAAAERFNRAARVIGAWVREPAYHDRRGRPRSLESEGEGSFAELVRRSSGDVPPRAVLDELLRVGSVERTKDGRHRLVTRAYVPRMAEAEKLEILGTDVSDLTSAIDHNLRTTSAEAFFQRTVQYDNLVAGCLPELRSRANRSGQRLLEQLDRFMSKHDRDTTPEVAGTPEAAGSGERARAVLGIYYWEEPRGNDR